MAGDKGSKETTGGDAPKTKGKRKDAGKSEVERPKKAPRAEKATAAPKSKADAGAKGKGKKADEGKAKKEKKVKDPNAPKKNLTAFMLFSNATRDKVKTDNPGVSFGDVGRLLGEGWKALDAGDKAEFEELAKKDKERYAKALEVYKEGNGEVAPAAAKAKPPAKTKPAAKKKEEDGDEGESDGGDDEEEEEDE